MCNFAIKKYYKTKSELPKLNEYLSKVSIQIRKKYKYKFKAKQRTNAQTARTPNKIRK